MLLIRDIDNRSLVLTYARFSTGCQCNYELTLKTCFWSKVKRRPYFSSHFKVSPILVFRCFLQQIKVIIITIIIIIKIAPVNFPLFNGVFRKRLRFYIWIYSSKEPVIEEKKALQLSHCGFWVSQLNFGLSPCVLCFFWLRISENNMEPWK